MIICLLKEIYVKGSFQSAMLNKIHTIEILDYSCVHISFIKTNAKCLWESLCQFQTNFDDIL